MIFFIRHFPYSLWLFTRKDFSFMHSALLGSGWLLNSPPTDLGMRLHGEASWACRPVRLTKLNVKIPGCQWVGGDPSPALPGKRLCFVKVNNTTRTVFLNNYWVYNPSSFMLFINWAGMTFYGIISVIPSIIFSELILFPASWFLCPLNLRKYFLAFSNHKSCIFP